MEKRSLNIENKGKLSMDYIVKNSLRRRSNRLILGEFRGKGP